MLHILSQISLGGTGCKTQRGLLNVLAAVMLIIGIILTVCLMVIVVLFSVLILHIIIFYTKQKMLKCLVLSLT